MTVSVLIQVISRFRVKNGMESAVRDAFLHRPHLVDAVAGFLGMEVFTERDAAAVFYLVTRWTDGDRFRDWHGSDAHRLSHRGIPRGLKLDREHTKITVLDRLPETAGPMSLDSVVADAAPFLAHCLANSRASAVLAADAEGIILACNEGMAGVLNRSPADVVGKAVWPFLPDADAESLRRRVANGPRDFDAHFLLNFVNAEHVPATLACRVDAQPGYFILFGEAPRDKSQHSNEELMQLNNQLAVLMRENAQKNKELEKAKAALTKAYDDLQTSHWHLRKIQEVLPICMACGKVKAESEWQDLVTYLKENALFLSHGYCPACTADLMAAWDLTTDMK